MVNKTKFYKTKVALAVVLSLGLAACGDSEGDAGSTSSSTTTSDATQPIVEDRSELRGTISGKVQDTNGRPVADAMVYFAGQETTTDAGGNYIFSDVLVTNLEGNNDEGNDIDDDEIPSLLTVTVSGPEGYISAVVTVEPQAVVNNTGGSDNNDGAVGSDVTASTFVDGFIAEAGTAVIAEENSMITGYMRTGNDTPAEGVTVYLDFTGYNSATQSGVTTGTTGASVTLTPGEYSAVTAADGSFTFENIPADSEFVLGATGWTISTADTDGAVLGTDGAFTVATTLEQDENFYGTFELVSNDFAVEVDSEYNPWVASVTGVLNPTVGITPGGGDPLVYGDLNDGINKEVTINFSEALDTTTFDASKVKIAETDGQYLEAVSTLSPDGLSLTVVFTEELDPGTKFTVYILQSKSLDDEANALNITRNITNSAVDTNTPPYTDGSVTTIVYDTLESINKAVYVKVSLCTFEDGVSGVEGATVAQEFDEDTAQDGDTSALQAYSDAFRDAESSETNGNANDNDIAQLNGDSLTATKLDALGDAVLVAKGGVELMDEVDTNFPWITIDSGNAATYTIDTDVQQTDDTNQASGTVFNGSTSMIDHGVDGAEDGDDIEVTFMDDFGVAAAQVEITLIDAVPPVTVLQENYNLYSVAGYDQLLNTTDAENDYGQGGEVSNDGTSAEAGNPIIWVQPRHLQQKGTNNAQPTRDSLNTFGTLSNLVPSLDTGETGFTATTYIDNRATYDADAYTAWAATSVSNEIGVDFSENVATTTTPATETGITAGLSGYTANNNVLLNVDGGASNADLIQVTVADVMTLANVDNTGFIDFVGAARDTSDSENVATADTNAKVIFRDAMPPLVTAAEWDGTEIELTFNEAVSITASTDITLVNPTAPGTTVTVTLDPAAVAGAAESFVMSNGNTTVTVNVTGTAGINTVFEGSDTADQEFFYEDGGNTGEDQHAIVRWDAITDATTGANKWDTFTPAAADAAGSQANNLGVFANRYQVEAPQFLMVNGVGSYNYTVSTAGYLDAGVNGDDDGTVTYTISFSHPIDISASDGEFADAIETFVTGGFPVSTASAITGSTATTAGRDLINAIFQVNIDGTALNSEFVLATTPVSATELHGALTLAADQRSITLTVTGLADSILFGTTTVAFEVETTSSLTSEQTSAAPFAWQNVN